MKVRTRFAPSPTGFQHIGGFRTAMYAWLLAKGMGGDFILRVEDTDQSRKVDGAVSYISESLQWLGIEFDEGPSVDDLKQIGEYTEGLYAPGGNYGPYVQSLRKPRYKEVSDLLIEKGHAYRCDCTPEMLAKERDEQRARKESPGYSGYCRTREVSADSHHVVRLKIPARLSLEMEDACRGRISWDSPPLKDPVILKADLFPTYHLASVVDDHDMEISHVLRGEEWIPTTPIHLYLYDVLEWQRPIFCHLSHILGSDGKKLSKRHGASSLDVFKKEGYLPEAILNYIVRIGWSPGEGDEQEIFTKEELINKFSLDHLSRSSGVYDTNKLQWMNGVYFREISLERFNEIAVPVLKDEFKDFNESSWGLIAGGVKERIKVLPDMIPMVRFLFEDKVDIDIDSMLTKKVDKELATKIINETITKFENLADFSLSTIEESLKSVVSDLDLKMGLVFVTIRIAVTGSKATPPLFDSILALGKEKVLERLVTSSELLA